MYGNYRARLPRLYDYKQALQHEADVTPIRGSTIKPIGVRRNKHMDIRLENQDVVCRLYQTDVVTYKPDGEIIIRLDGFETNTSTGFINDLLGGGFYIFDYRVWVQCKSKGADEGGSSPAFPLHSTGENVFVRDEHRRLVFKNPPINTVHKVNRAAANKVRKQYTGFKNYVRGVFKVRLNESGKVPISREELRAVFGTEPERLNFYRGHPLSEPRRNEVKALMQSADPADMYKAFLWVAVSTQGYLFWSEVREKEVGKDIDALITHIHRDEVFIEASCFGEQKRDAYSRFF